MQRLPKLTTLPRPLLLAGRLLLATLVAPLAYAVEPPPSTLSQLALGVAGGDELRRFEFADALLAVLQETYAEELAASSREKASSEARRTKLRRWRAATQTMLQRFDDARLALGEGAEAVIIVDAQRQILLFIGEQSIAFSAPRPGEERRLEQEAVARFCAFNDCSDVQQPPSDAETDAGASGTWTLRSGQPPAYDIGTTLRCVFRDLSVRADKQQACEEAAQDTAVLIKALRHISVDGQAIDWQRLAAQRSASGPDLSLYPLAYGSALRLTLPRLARLDDDAWRGFIRQLADHLRDGRGPVQVEQGERLLKR